MSAEDPDPYAGRGQTRVKHFVLGEYLERLAFKIGSRGGTLNYIDGFAGAWGAQAPGLSDSSAVIAANVLRGVRGALKSRLGVDLHLRMRFVERDRRRFDELQQHLAKVNDVDARPIHGSFEASIPELVRFAGEGTGKRFVFTLIDPWGWTGFGLEKIRPLLGLQHSEVLINFMTNHVRRFIGAAAVPFDVVYGDDSYRARLEGLVGQDREDAMVDLYARRVRDAGNFRFAATSVVLMPERDRTHYHLVYATRHPMGLTVFREVERRALSLQDQVRSEAQRRRRARASGGQGEMFDPSKPYVHELRARYHGRARKLLLDRIENEGDLPYDVAFELALSIQMVAESDLKRWIEEWRKEGRIELFGLAPRKRVPEFGAGQSLTQKRRGRTLPE
jgi:three-Cys-motif partner protein